MVKYKQTVEKGEKAGKKLSLLTHDTKDVGVSRSLNDKLFPNIDSKIFIKKGTEYHNIVLKLIDDIKKENPSRREVSRHLLEEENNRYFSYLICDGQKVKKHFIFYEKKISNFIKNNYSTHNFVVTKSKNDKNVWFTVSMAIEMAEVENLLK